MGRFLCVLRSWLLMVSVIAAGNTLQCFRDYSFVSEKLYTASPGLGKGWGAGRIAGPGRAAVPRGWGGLPCGAPPAHLGSLPPSRAVNGLQARTFGVWTLLSSVVRCLCALDIRNQTYVREAGRMWGMGNGTGGGGVQKVLLGGWGPPSGRALGAAQGLCVSWFCLLPA